MSEWWTYTLSDFLLFSPRTYYRLLELYNLQLWPAQLAGVAIGLTIIVLLAGKRGSRDRIIPALLAACWLWVAWAFHYERYAQINWMAPWFAAVFAFEGLLLVVLGVLAGRIIFQPPSGGGFWIAILLIASAVLLYPALAPLVGRPWMTAETFGLAPDPTAVATVAALALVRGRIRWLLLVVPLLWLAVTVATMWAMDAPEALVLAGTALLALVPAACRTNNSGSGEIR